MRRNITNNGAKKIVSLFDQGSADEYTHALQKENYVVLLEELLRNSELGVIIKPKSPETLEKRLGKEIADLITTCVKTGRCCFFQESSNKFSNIPVTLAAYASDLCICSNLKARQSISFKSLISPLTKAGNFISWARSKLLE